MPRPYQGLVSLLVEQGWLGLLPPLPCGLSSRVQVHWKVGGQGGVLSVPPSLPPPPTRHPRGSGASRGGLANCKGFN